LKKIIVRKTLEVFVGKKLISIENIASLSRLPHKFITSNFWNGFRGAIRVNFFGGGLTDEFLLSADGLPA
jgi:hypothetical protein